LAVFGAVKLGISGGVTATSVASMLNGLTQKLVTDLSREFTKKKVLYKDLEAKVRAKVEPKIMESLNKNVWNMFDQSSGNYLRSILEKPWGEIGKAFQNYQGRPLPI
jgi:hypothetical protein